MLTLNQNAHLIKALASNKTGKKKEEKEDANSEANKTVNEKFAELKEKATKFEAENKELKE